MNTTRKFATVPQPLLLLTFFRSPNTEHQVSGTDEYQSHQEANGEREIET